MNITTVKTAAGFQTYKSKAKKTEKAEEQKPAKTDTVELSTDITSSVIHKYLDNSFLDDPKFDKQFEALINEILN
jgi:hypothetical protein